MRARSPIVRGVLGDRLVSRITKWTLLASEKLEAKQLGKDDDWQDSAARGRSTHGERRLVASTPDEPDEYHRSSGLRIRSENATIASASLVLSVSLRTSFPPLPGSSLGRVNQRPPPTSPPVARTAGSQTG